MKNILFAFLLCLLFSQVAAQTRSVRKKIIVTQDLSSDGYKADTTIIEYDRNGTPIPDPRRPYLQAESLVYIDSITVLDSSAAFIHKRQYWSDSSSYDIFIRHFKDSCLKITLKGGDTSEIKKYYYRNARLYLVKWISSLPGRDPDMYPLDIDFHTSLVKAIVLFCSFNGMQGDSIKIEYDYTHKVFARLKYNPEKNKYFLQEKIKLKDRRRVVIGQNCPRSCPQTKTVISYNTSGEPVVEVRRSRYPETVAEERWEKGQWVQKVGVMRSFQEIKYFYYEYY